MLEKLQNRIEHCSTDSQSYQLRQTMQRRMSAQAAHIRDARALYALQEELKTRLEGFWTEYVLAAPGGLAQMLKTRDMLITQAAVVSAMQLSARTWGSRGSGLVLDSRGTAPAAGLEAYCALPDRAYGMDQVIETVWCGNSAHSSFALVRPIPERDNWFENVWREYRHRTAALVR